MQKDSILAWMVKNKTTTNLLMICLLIGGFFSMQNIKKEVFPDIKLDIINITVEYPGASPEEIENSVTQTIESVITGIDGVKRITSTTKSGVAIVQVKLFDFVDKNIVLQDIKNEIDRIKTFPKESERPKVEILVRKLKAVSLVVYGGDSLNALRKNAEKVKNDLMDLEKISLVEIESPRAMEISVEVKKHQLEELSLTLSDIANSINNFSKEISAGIIKSSSGDINIRSNERRETAIEFNSIPILSGNGSSSLVLGDIATIKDGFAEDDQESFFNRQQAIKINIFSVGDESPVEVANVSKQYLKEYNKIDRGVKIDLFEDLADMYESRVDLLVKNSCFGLILLLIILGIFLDVKLAFWVMTGLPISMIGSFILLQSTSTSINMVSLFSFIVILGIVVDDAIIVGEAIHEKRLQGCSFIEAAIYGVEEMFKPVVFAVLTNIISFLPLVFVPGPIGDIFRQIPTVVISVLVISLIESLFILPAHLSYSDSKLFQKMGVFNTKFKVKFNNFINNRFYKFVSLSVKNKYTTLCCCVGALIIIVGLINGGIVKFSFLPKVDQDVITVEVSLPFGVPIKESRRVLKVLTDSAYKTIKENGGSKISRGVYSSIGENASGSHNLKILVSLVSSDKRDISGIEFASEWEKNSGKIVGLKSITFSGKSVFSSQGKDIQIDISHPNKNIQKTISREVVSKISEYNGVLDLSDGIEIGNYQLDFTLKEEANSLNIKTSDLFRQVRGAFYGIEALRQQRGENEVKVIVRLSRSEREDINTLEDLKVKDLKGQYIPLKYITDVKYSRSYTKIEHSNRKRVLVVTASIDDKVANLNEIMQDLQKHIMPELKQRYPEMTYSFEGEEKERKESLIFLKKAFILGILSIYVLLAIAFNSYFQPIVVMLSIPFGIIGAVIGHALLGYQISISSLIGIVGLTGIVINDSLVLVITINRNYEITKNKLQSTIDAAVRRFHPIFLTTATTFFGLLPMVFETSKQAKFLIPMAISISFGVLFSTIIVIVLVPSIYLILEDLKDIFDSLRKKIF